MILKDNTGASILLTLGFLLMAMNDWPIASGKLWTLLGYDAKFLMLVGYSCLATGKERTVTGWIGLLATLLMIIPSGLWETIFASDGHEGLKHWSHWACMMPHACAAVLLIMATLKQKPRALWRLVIRMSGLVVFLLVITVVMILRVGSKDFLMPILSYLVWLPFCALMFVAISHVPLKGFVNYMKSLRWGMVHCFAGYAYLCGANVAAIYMISAEPRLEGERWSTDLIASAIFAFITGFAMSHFSLLQIKVRDVLRTRYVGMSGYSVWFKILAGLLFLYSFGAMCVFIWACFESDGYVARLMDAVLYRSLCLNLFVHLSKISHVVDLYTLIIIGIGIMSVYAFGLGCLMCLINTNISLCMNVKNKGGDND